MEDNEKQVLSQILKKLDSMEQRLERLEQGSQESQIKVDLPPALARMLKILAETNKAAGSEEVSKRAGISRNLTSAYLTRLTDMGYLVREPNLDRNLDARYVFRLNKGNLPDTVRKLIK